MYQLEVKAKLVAATFPPSEGWDVCVDIDPMERCQGGTHPAGKRERVRDAEARLRALGVRVGAHPTFGRADIVATHPIQGTVVVEVEGTSARQKEQAMYSALGQTVLMMSPAAQRTYYALAVPDDADWHRQLRKIPREVAALLRLRLILVGEDGVRELSDVDGLTPLDAADVHARFERALTTFADREHDLIRRDPSERSLTHRLAVHLEREFPTWNVDCEYNRLGDRPKVIAVQAPRRVETDADDAVTAFPDIIVHLRGPAGPNLLIVEAKKASSHTDTGFDHLKLAAYHEQLGYIHAAFVTLPSGDRGGSPVEWLCPDA